MEALILIGRTAVLWLTALIVFRLMGKRTLGKMGPFDFAVAIMIGDPIMVLKGMECHAGEMNAEVLAAFGHPGFVGLPFERRHVRIAGKRREIKPIANRKPVPANLDFLN